MSDTMDAPHHPFRSALLWAAAAYGLGALAWVVVVAAVVAAGSADSVSEALIWWVTGAATVAIVAVGAAVIAIPLLMAETTVWRIVAARFRLLEDGYAGIAAAAALLALPWLLLDPFGERWSALLSFAAAFFGLFAARVMLRRLHPGALLN
jgi:hypothetical protein